MAKLRVISKFRGSRNGIDVEVFNVGDVVNSSYLGDDLAAVAFREKWVEVAEQDQNPEKRETKASQDLEKKAPAAPKKARARKPSSAPKRRSAKKMTAEDDES